MNVVKKKNVTLPDCGKEETHCLFLLILSRRLPIIPGAVASLVAIVIPYVINILLPELMNLIDFYRKESSVSGVNILFVAIVSGLANGALLAVIGIATRKISHDGVQLRIFLLFAVALMLFIIGKKYALVRATVFIESLINKVRVRISNKIRHTELQFLENLDKSYIYTRVTEDTNFISQSAMIIINACQSVIMLVFCLVYIAWLSKLAFIITVGSIVAAILIYFSYRKETNQLLRQATQKETELFGTLSHILDGFKEIKVNRKKSDDLFGYFQEIAGSTEKIKVKTGINFARDYIFSEIFFYSLIAAIVFLLPTLTSTQPETITKTVMAVLFIIGPLTMVVSALPIFARANMAVANLYNLETALDKAGNGVQEADIVAGRPIESFDEVRLEKLTFSYQDAEGRVVFTLGPIDLSIQHGETLFLVGGNGSGKSTLLKLLTGLYYPTFGAIYLDRNVVSKTQYPSYRELFSIIFADFHLFDRLYGLGAVDVKKINNLIKLMELSEKTRYADGKFSDIHLSTGQRKRLALIVAFLDERPIYVFDEVAADQDPQFRKYFYEVILRDLKQEGKTIVAATHDDKYFHIADRIIKMDYGKLQNLS